MTFGDLQETLIRLAVAALGGLAVGIEREWSARQEGTHSRFGGVRTFLLLALIGALAATLFTAVDPRAGLLVLAGGILLVAVAYFVSAWHGSVDATTEVAGVIVLSTGFLAGLDFLALGSAVAAGTALVLVEKSRMHSAVERLQSAELEAAARFAVLALVVLPVLPTGPYAAFGGIEPRKLWALVLLFAGLSFTGYVALRVAGPQRGYGVAGVLGGVVSSTAVTLNFARESRKSPETARALGLGIVAACAVLPARVGVLLVALNADVARALAPALALPLVGGIVIAALGWRRAESEGGKAKLPDNPLRLGGAIQLAVLFQIVLWLLAWARGEFGEGGLYGTAALLGLTDLDALTFSASELAKSGTAATAAARALLIGMLSNTLFKLGLAASLGTAALRRAVVPALLLVALLFGVAIWLG